MISLRLLRKGAPVFLSIEMSSTADSIAQVYFDAGSNFNESDSVTTAVAGNQEFRELRFPLPRATMTRLRFDPLRTAGTVNIRNVRIVDAGGNVLRAIAPSQIKPHTEIKEIVEIPGGLRVTTVDNSIDSALLMPLDPPLRFATPLANSPMLREVILLNAAIWSAALIVVVLGPRIKLIDTPFAALDARFGALAGSVSSPHFITFDRLAIWFYTGCLALFLFNVACDLNGSSLEFNTLAFHQYGDEEVVAGTPKGIRSDEWNFVSPYMFYQAFRPDKFEARDSPFGGFYTSLMGNVPVRHITTLFRPQYWGFFTLPLDYAFSFFWQMKWLIMITGVFTLLLLLTGSSWLSIAGALWLFFSDFTQWTYSWPSMLPEMCGTFCFVTVLAMYLTVGRRRWVMAVCSLLLAVCAVNFALCAYVPHLLPYLWTGVFLFTGWVYSRRNSILLPEGRTARAIALGAAVVLASVMMWTFYRDAAPSIAGISATIYPGHRSADGGIFTFSDFTSHFFGPVEDQGIFPARMGNVCEAAGFFWLAPVTLLCWSAIRSLNRERKILLLCLWISALMLVGWDLIPIPASWGRWLLLDKIYPQRTLPALGLLNAAIVMLVLSAPGHRRRLSLDMKALISAGIVLLGLAITNSAVGNIFKLTDVLLVGLWLTLQVALLWNVNPRAFAAVALIPGFYFFGLVNPVSRGVGAITNSQLFQFVEGHKELRTGKWLVLSPDHFFGVFAACGLNSYVGMHYLPKIQDFKVFQQHGVDIKDMNSGGMLIAKPLEPGKKSFIFSPVPGLEEWSVTPSDSLLKDLGIRYVAFDRAPNPALVTGLAPLSASPVSGFWLYELRP